VSPVAHLLKRHLERALELPVLITTEPALRAIVLAPDREQAMDELDFWCEFCHKDYRNYAGLYYVPSGIRAAGNGAELTDLVFEVSIEQV